MMPFAAGLIRRRTPGHARRVPGRLLPWLLAAVAAGQLDKAVIHNSNDDGMKDPATMTGLRKTGRAAFAAQTATAVTFPVHVVQCVCLLFGIGTRIHEIAYPFDCSVCRTSPPGACYAGMLMPQ